MIHVAIKDAKNRLSALVRSVEDGDRVAITRNGKPVADLVAHQPQRGGFDFALLERWKQENGVSQLVTFVDADFDDPLPEDALFGSDD